MVEFGPVPRAKTTESSGRARLLDGLQGQPALPTTRNPYQRTQQRREHVIGGRGLRPSHLGWA